MLLKKPCRLTFLSEVTKLIKCIIISDDQFFILGLVDYIYVKFKEQEVFIKVTNFKNYLKCIDSANLMGDKDNVYIIVFDEERCRNIKYELRLKLHEVICDFKSFSEFDEKILTKNSKKASRQIFSLSTKEFLICKLFKEDYSDNIIAKKLNITTKTLSCHRRNIMTKIKANTRMQFVLFCKRL